MPETAREKVYSNSIYINYRYYRYRYNRKRKSSARAVAPPASLSVTASPRRNAKKNLISEQLVISGDGRSRSLIKVLRSTRAAKIYVYILYIYTYNKI